MTAGKIVHSDADATVFQSWCPSCDWPLWRRVAYNVPVYGSVSWHNMDGDQVSWCPRCDDELPLSELDAREAAA